MKKWQALLAYIIYFLLMSLINWQWRWALLYWVLGGALGMGFEFVDRLVYVYLVKPTDQLSLYIKHLLMKYKFKEAFSVLQARKGEQIHISSESILFMIGWLVLAIYVITSTGSVIAMGLVMGIGLRFLLGASAFWSNPNSIQEKYFWQIKRRLSGVEMKAVLGLIGLGFGWLSLVLVNL